MERFSIGWHDRGREPTQKSDPAYPQGKDVIAVEFPTAPTCKVDLPYPAKRCGIYAVLCYECGLSIGVTTAGRPDDPRSLTVNCLTERN